MEGHDLAAQAVEGNSALHYIQILKVTYRVVNPSSNCILKRFGHEYHKLNIQNGD